LVQSDEELVLVHIGYEVVGIAIERKRLFDVLGIDIVFGECPVCDVVDEQPLFPFCIELTRYVYTAVEQGKSDFDESEVFGVARKASSDMAAQPFTACL
jgi:hypothetical protein